LPAFTLIRNINGFFRRPSAEAESHLFIYFCAPIIKYVGYDPGRHQFFFSKITIEKKIGGGKVLTRIAIHILGEKGELLIWRKNGHFPHCIVHTQAILQAAKLFCINCGSIVALHCRQFWTYTQIAKSANRD
jgi:hypothetical protein